MINHHFGGKQALFDAILEQFSTDEMAAPVRIITEPAGSKEEFELKFRLFVSEAFEVMIAQRLVFQIVSKENNVFLPLTSFRNTLLDFATSAHRDGYVRQDVAVEMIIGLVLDRLVNQVLYAAALDETAPSNVVLDLDYRKYWLKCNIDLMLNGLV